MTVTQEGFLADSYGARYGDVAKDAIFGPALRSAIDVLNRPDSRRRMTEAVELYGIPPLAAVVHEIESTPAFRRASGRFSKREMARLSQAVGLAVKFAMAVEGFEPSEVNGRQDQGRLDVLPNPPRCFTTARRYVRQAKSKRTIETNGGHGGLVHT